jgi:outer membrane protein OmpA-like peptidoglycan-associated protein
MGLTDDAPGTTTRGPSLKPDSPKVSTRLLWILVVLALVAIAGCALFFVQRLNHLEDQLTQLTGQVEQTQRDAHNAAERSQAAIHQASQAQASAQQAALQRDQAEKDAAQSNKQAALAQHQAQAAQGQAALAQQQAQQYRQQREAELNRLQQVLGQIAETRRTAMGLIMTLGSNSIRFDFDKSNLRPENREILSRIAGILMTLKGYQIAVFGYTDDIGTQEYNLKLSGRRAQAVRDYLVKAGLDPNIITWKGFGKSDPRVPGNSPAARAANRRVEIAIVDHRLQVQAIVPPGK